MDLEFIIAKSKEFFSGNPQNVVAAANMLQLYDFPLFGVAGATDNMWEEFKRADVIGAHHLSPAEWLPGAKSVVVYFMPFTKTVKTANRNSGMPAAEWLYGRYEGEVFNAALRKFIAGLIVSAGGKASVPIFDERFTVKNFRSNWSERHAAYAAGLGTFSLSRSLITAAGSAGRVGAIVTDLALEPTVRNYDRFDEYCSKCGACIKRCPANSIDENGKDNASCSQHLDKTMELFKPRYGCGKCQTAVPCESRIPPKKKQ